MVLPMMSTHVARMKVLKNILYNLSQRMGSSSSESVLRNFIEILQSASPQLRLAVVLLTPWALLTTAVLKYAWAARCFQSVKTFVSDCLFASVSIPSTHPLNRQILGYMVEHGLGKNARTLALTAPYAGVGSSAWLEVERMMESSYRYDHYHSKRTAQSMKHLKDDDPDKRALSYVPEVGKYVFWYKWHRMTFERKTVMQETLDSKGRRAFLQGSVGSEVIVISCTSPLTGAAPIQEFLQHIQAAPNKDRTTTIYRPNAQNAAWDQGISRPSRNLNAVTLDSKVKDELVKDVQTYLSAATRKYYANRGIPYRRGLLFYGNPGCGKTSFTNALAGHFGLNVYMFSLSSNTIHDGTLELLFEQLPSRCIVLLEDIDSAGLKRETMREKPVMRRAVPQPRVYDSVGNLLIDPELDLPDRQGVTLSGLLNVLDGIHSKEGMLTIMTSNSPDTLDPALVRPGRIDRKILFGYCSTEVLTKLFRHIFEKAPEEVAEGETAVPDTKHDIAALAQEFAKKIPADRLTPAEVQGFLLVHREDPVAAVAAVEEWAISTIERKAAGANVDTFSSEMQKAEGEAGGESSAEESDEPNRSKRHRRHKERMPGRSKHRKDTVDSTKTHKSKKPSESHKTGTKEKKADTILNQPPLPDCGIFPLPGLPFPGLPPLPDMGVLGQANTQANKARSMQFGGRDVKNTFRVNADHGFGVKNPSGPMMNSPYDSFVKLGRRQDSAVDIPILDFNPPKSPTSLKADDISVSCTTKPVDMVHDDADLGLDRTSQVVISAHDCVIHNTFLHGQAQSPGYVADTRSDNVNSVKPPMENPTTADRSMTGVPPPRNDSYIHGSRFGGSMPDIPVPGEPTPPYSSSASEGGHQQVHGLAEAVEKLSKKQIRQLKKKKVKSANGGMHR